MTNVNDIPRNYIYSSGYSKPSNPLAAVVTQQKLMENAATQTRVDKAISNKAGTPIPSSSVPVYSQSNSGKSAATSVGSVPQETANTMAQLQSVTSTNSKALESAWREQNQLAMDFNSSEAAKNRDWQEMMSNTAHQREVADLKAAGLNPILSATGGNGAAVTSGSAASMQSGSAGFGIDSAESNGLAALLGTIVNAQASMHNASVSAAATLGAAGTSASASRYASDTSRVTSQMMADAQKYSADTGRGNSIINSVSNLLRGGLTAAAMI